MCKADFDKEEYMKTSHIKKVKPVKTHTVAANSGADPGGCRPIKVN